MKMIFVLFAALIAASTVQAEQTPAMKEWTFLVYLNADNNLYNFGLANLKQMEQVGSTQDLNIVVEFDHAGANKPTQRLLVNKGQSQVVQSLGETNMGDWKHLAEFVTWGIQNYPAKHYALMVWNHGAGWRGISYDDNPRAFISMPELSQALKQVQATVGPQLARRGMRAPGPVIDILNYDACLMSTLEVAYEMKDTARIMVGSQFNEPGEGEDYNALLSRLVTEPRLDPRGVAEHMVYQYVQQYPTRREINYLAVDLSKIPSFTQLFREAAKQHLTAPGPIQSQLKQFYASSPEGSDFIGGLNGALKIAGTNSSLPAAIGQVISAYGYPAENAGSLEPGGPAESGRKVLRVTRAYPAQVAYRNSTGGAWQKLALNRQANGTYSATLPAATIQYMVQPQNALSPRESRPTPEAMSTFVRAAGPSPIVFHNQFPASSPVIADAHTVSTKGATGMSLYFGADRRMKNQARTQPPREGLPDLATQYKALSFAKEGAPEWTQFLGL